MVSYRLANNDRNKSKGGELMADKSEIVCITVLYNPDSDVVKNVAQYHGLVGKIILVDNSSEDNRKMFLGMEDVEYVPLMENTGIAHATNVGIKMSQEPYILTMDQDSKITANLVAAYLNYLNTKDDDTVGALTPQYETDRTNAKKISEEATDILLSMQSGTLIKRSTFKKIGLLQENLFIDVVDWEFFLRMNRSGFRLVRINAAILVHQPATTKSIGIGPINIKYGIASPIRYYYQARNLLWVANKYRASKLYVNLIVKWLKIVVLFDHKRVYLQLFYQGIKDARNNLLGKKI